MPLEVFLISIAGIVGTVMTLRGPIGRALAARIEGRRPPDHDRLAELEELRPRVLILEEGQTHLAELQERVEFAERVLARDQQRRPELPS